MRNDVTTQKIWKRILSHILRTDLVSIWAQNNLTLGFNLSSKLNQTTSIFNLSSKWDQTWFTFEFKKRTYFASIWSQNKPTPVSYKPCSQVRPQNCTKTASHRTGPRPVKKSTNFFYFRRVLKENFAQNGKMKKFFQSLTHLHARRHSGSNTPGIFLQQSWNFIDPVCRKVI